MGGEKGLTAAALDPRIRAVVSEGGTFRVWDDATFLVGRRALLMPFYLVATQACRPMASATPPMPLAEAVTRVAPRPVLLISASDLAGVGQAQVGRSGSYRRAVAQRW
jgi:hypothetical protein